MQGSKNQTLPVLVNSHHKSNCYLQVISVIFYQTEVLKLKQMFY